MTCASSPLLLSEGRPGEPEVTNPHPTWGHRYQTVLAQKEACLSPHPPHPLATVGHLSPSLPKEAIHAFPPGILGLPVTVTSD